MADLEKVKYSIVRCISHVPDACRDCAYDAVHPCNECVEMMLKDVLSLLKERKEVILCKDCKYGWETGDCNIPLNGQIQCSIHEDGYDLHNPDWFCADGVKRNE